MLIRFAVLAADSDSGRKQGILVAAHTLRDEGDLSVEDHTELRTAIAWFNENIPVPAMLDKPEHRRAISWFKPSANEAIQRMWRLKQLLDTHGLHVDVLRSDEPGTIVYEDDLQVVAKPQRS